MLLAAETATWLGFVPLAWLMVQESRGARLDIAYWWLGAAFAVSWVTDMLAHVADPWVLSLAYPISQASLVAAVLISRRETFYFLALLCGVGIIASLHEGPRGPDILLRTVAFGSVAGIAMQRRELGTLCTSLLVYFGCGVLAWWAYAIAPGWWTWGSYQFTRLVGITLFCLAALRPIPRLRLV